MNEENVMRESKQIQAEELALLEESEITIKSLCLKMVIIIKKEGIRTLKEMG